MALTGSGGWWPGVETTVPPSVTYRTQYGQQQTRRADNVIMALGATPDDALVRELQGVCGHVHCVGDAEALGYIEGAVRSGNRVAREI